jgi:DnaJ-class molecular chaperone
MDHYSTLGVSKTASQEEIKKAYRKQAMQHHPDRTGGDDTKFKEIQTAYDTLSDPQKRQQYDNPRPQMQGFPGGFGFNVNGFDLNDLFGQAFGHQHPFNQQRNQTPTYRTRLNVSLMDVYKENEHVLQLNTPTGSNVVNVKIPRGTQSGDHVRYDKIIPGAQLIVEFIVLSDLKYDRKGDDLYANMPVSVLDLIVGNKIQFDTISGKTLDVTIRPKTQPYMQLRIPGEGMPSRNGGYGDQILLLKPYIPDIIDNEIVEIITRHQQTK